MSTVRVTVYLNGGHKLDAVVPREELDDLQASLDAAWAGQGRGGVDLPQAVPQQVVQVRADAVIGYTFTLPAENTADSDSPRKQVRRWPKSYDPQEWARTPIQGSRDW